MRLRIEDMVQTQHSCQAVLASCQISTEGSGLLWHHEAGSGNNSLAQVSTICPLNPWIIRSTSIKRHALASPPPGWAMLVVCSAGQCEAMGETQGAICWSMTWQGSWEHWRAAAKLSRSESRWILQLNEARCTQVWMPSAMNKKWPQSQRAAMTYLGNSSGIHRVMRSTHFQRSLQHFAAILATHFGLRLDQAAGQRLGEAATELWCRSRCSGFSQQQAEQRPNGGAMKSANHLTWLPWLMRCWRQNHRRDSVLSPKARSERS